MGSIFGERLKVSIFGESHGAAVGVTLDGLPPGIALDLDKLTAQMDRRRPGGGAFSTPRSEKDRFEILSGFFNGRTTGTPLCAVIYNTDAKSGGYDKNLPRPGHADLAAEYKYGGYQDYRGGGHFSGRLTAPLVLAGGIAKQLLESREVFVAAKIESIGKIRDERRGISEITACSETGFPVYCGEKREAMLAEIAEAKKDGDSVGGEILCAAFNLKRGLGDPFFGSLESRISAMMFSIPAVKGIEFGAGFGFASMRGSEANDEIYCKDEKISHRTNNNGGITGGISNGEPLVFKLAVKPTPSIAKMQSTVNLTALENSKLAIKGRHDACIVPRAVPVAECALALVLAEYYI